MVKEAIKTASPRARRAKPATARESLSDQTSGITMETLIWKHEQLKGLHISTGEVVEIIRAGIPTSTIDEVAHKVNTPLTDIAEALRINIRTLARRRSAGVLSSDESEKVLRMARVIKRSVEVFGDTKSAAEWLKTPNKAMNGQTPLSLLDTDIGSEIVMDTLGRIEHGVFA